MTVKELESKVNLLSLIAEEYKISKVGDGLYRVNPCPVCGRRDHFTIYPETNSYSSFNKCCQGGSVYRYLQEVKGIDKEQAYEELQRLAGEHKERPTKAQRTAGAREPSLKDYTDFINELYHAQSEKDKGYFIQRGISLEIIDKYKLCIGDIGDGKRAYIPTWKNGKVVTYTGRAIEGQEPKYMNTSGSSYLFNGEVLDKAGPGDAVLICEGAFDALSLESAGYKAVALGGTQHIEKLKRAIEETPGAEALLLLTVFDNDEAGRQAADKENWPQIEIPREYNDINEWAISDMEEMKVSIAKQVQRIKGKELEEYKKNNAYSYIDDFKDGIKESANTPAIKTGFAELDSILEGGLYEGLYFIGAISSLGKTTFVMQIADQMAQQGQDVLIFSLEMARSELMAKSISRLTWLNTDNRYYAKTMRGITAGKRYEEYKQVEKDLIRLAINKYSEYAKSLYILEGVGNIGVTQVREAIEKHIRITGNKPVVAIDYLQILAPYEIRATDKQNTDKAVLELKRISRDHKIPIIGISSFNRQNYSNGVSMEAFKESGAIEYSSDVLIGLQLAGAGDKEFNVDEAKRKDPREVELKILKNRNGATGKTIKYDYYPLFNYFEEIGEAEKAEAVRM